MIKKLKKKICHASLLLLLFFFSYRICLLVLNLQGKLKRKTNNNPLDRFKSYIVHRKLWWWWKLLDKVSNLSEVRIWFVPSQNRWSVVLDVMRMIEWIRIERLPIGASPYRFWIQNVKWIRCHVNFAMFCRLIRIMHTFPGLQRA